MFLAAATFFPKPETDTQKRPQTSQQGPQISIWAPERTQTKHQHQHQHQHHDGVRRSVPAQRFESAAHHCLQGVAKCTKTTVRKYCIPCSKLAPLRWFLLAAPSPQPPNRPVVYTVVICIKKQTKNIQKQHLSAVVSKGPYLTSRSIQKLK
jgi:hypothetical protein